MSSEEFANGSAVMSSSVVVPSWWDLHNHAGSSWSVNHMWRQQNPNLNSPREEEDASLSASSFTSVTNRLNLTVESPPGRFVEPASSINMVGGEAPSDNHIWSQVLLSAGSNEEAQNEENLLEALSSSKGIASGVFEPACDYLKKLDTTSDWGFMRSLCTTTTDDDDDEKTFTGYNHNGTEDHGSISRLSNNLSNQWSIAPPSSEPNHQFDPQPCNISLSSSTDQYLDYSNICHSEQNFASGYDSKMEKQSHHQAIEVAKNINSALFRRSIGSYGYGYHHQFGLNNLREKHHQSGAYCKSYEDIIDASKPLLKSLEISNCKKIQSQMTSSARNSGKGQERSKDGKKKRCKDVVETTLKKPKQESSSTEPSPTSEVQAPKVKIADKISALQQIVSPFGKTDAASVLQEAIGYIRFLQGQVQLLTNPYLKSNNSNKDPWGNLGRKDPNKLDLKSKGLCLAPISCTPPVCRESTAPDYWPTYRGCLYR